MSVIWFLLFGLIIGFIARALFPGRQNMGLAPTTLLGCAGSLVGGFIGNLLGGTVGQPGTTSTAGFFGSVVGALALLGIATAVSRARHHHEHGV